MNIESNLNYLVGKTIKLIQGLEKESEEVKIITDCGREYIFYHEQDCCESVYLNDFEYSGLDFNNALILSVEIVINHENLPIECEEECGTWTFYKIETNKGGLWMRWLGESNGYYSESVDFCRVK